MSWAHIQGTGTQAAGAVTSLSVAFGSNITSGNMIATGVATYCTPTDTLTATDNAGGGGNTYTSDTTAVVGSNNYWVTISHAPITLGTGTKPTVTWTASGTSPTMYPSIAIDEFSYGGTLSVDSHVSYNNTTVSTASPSVGSLTVTGNDLIYAVLGFDASAPTVTAGSGLTLSYSAGCVNGQAEGIAAEYQLNATTTVNPSWTLSAPATTYRCGVAYKTPTGATNGPPYWLGDSAFRPSQRPALSGTQISLLYG